MNLMYRWINSKGKFKVGEYKKEAVKKIVSHPDYKQFYKVLFDLRDIACDLSVMDVQDLAVYMAAPDPKFPSKQKVAIVISGEKELDHSSFFETCARNRGLYVKSFQNIDSAEAWLETDIP